MTNASAIADLRHPDAEQLLRSPDPARLAYDGRDGFPRVIPIGFLWNGSAIVVCTAPTAPKVKALTERPQIALTIDDIGVCEINEAFASVDRALELADNVPETWVALVAFLVETGGKKEAEAVIEQARKKLPADQAPLALAACRRFCVGSLTPLPADLEFSRAVLIVTLRERRRARSEEPPVRRSVMVRPNRPGRSDRGSLA